MSRNISRVFCLLLSPCRTEATILSTNQRTACVARTCWPPFRRLRTPTGGYCGMSTAQAGPCPLLAVRTRTVPHLCIPNPNALLETRHKSPISTRGLVLGLTGSCSFFHLLVANWLRSELSNPISCPALPDPEHLPQHGGEEACSCSAGEGEEKGRPGGEGRRAGGAEDRRRLQGEPGGPAGG